MTSKRWPASWVETPALISRSRYVLNTALGGPSTWGAFGSHSKNSFHIVSCAGLACAFARLAKEKAEIRANRKRTTSLRDCFIASCLSIVVLTSRSADSAREQRQHCDSLARTHVLVRSRPHGARHWLDCAFSVQCIIR